MTDPILSATGLCAGYGRVPVLQDVSVHVAPGEVVAVIGPNGAGKTTTMRALAGLLRPTAGEILFHGRPVRGPLDRRARDGLSYVPEGRAVFQHLSVSDNLRLAAGSSAACVALFPEIGRLLRRRAGLLSGGEQQMLALGRALRPSTRLLLADELSLGLAPLVVSRLLTAVKETASRGTAVLLVEQQVDKVLTVADRVYVMDRGCIVLEGTSADIRRCLDTVQQSYLSSWPARKTVGSSPHGQGSGDQPTSRVATEGHR